MAFELAAPVDDEGPWEPEPRLPDGHVLYMRVSTNKFTELDGKLVPESVVFKNFGDPPHEPGMSTEWCRYASPHDTRMRAKLKPPSDYGVISLPVTEIGTIPKQRVEHTPIFVAPNHPENNQAHTDVYGPKHKDELIQLEQAASQNSAEGLPRTPREVEERSIRLGREATAIRNRFQTCASVEIPPGAPLGTGSERRQDCQAH